MVRKKREVFERRREAKAEKEGEVNYSSLGGQSSLRYYTLEQGYFLRNINKRRNKPNKLHLQKSVYIEAPALACYVTNI